MSGFARSLGGQIFIGMVVGIVVGTLLGERAAVFQPLGDLFIRLLLMAAIPLVFFNLLAGLTSANDLGLLGRLGSRIVAFFFATTVVAVALGLGVTHVLQPGVGMQLTTPVSDDVGRVPRITDVLVDLVPENIVQAFGGGQVAQVVIFAVLLGIAALLLPEEQRLPIRKAFDVSAALFRKLVHVILYVGPLGIGALAAASIGVHGRSLLGPLAIFVAGVWGAEVVMALIYLVLVWAFTDFGPLQFLRLTGPLYATTAATCSSLASMVVSMDLAEKRLAIPKDTYSFTLPLGAQLNKDGTAIMLAGVLLFTAQAGGIEFGFASLGTVVLIGLILSSASGGIPGGGLVVALVYVQAFGLPLEIAAIVGGVYRLIDMGNTTINCMGDLVGTAIVARTERRRAARA